MKRTRSNRDESDSDLQSTTDPELIIRNRKRSQRLETFFEMHKACRLPRQVESTTEGNHKEKSTSSDCSSDFECNICIEVAKEPVVTCCGHLFCWPCLYQWFHFHGGHKDCPVCKGKVSESSLVPIYGRGNSETPLEKKNKEDEFEGLKIPPRPKGKRVEGWRHRAQSPPPRRPVERIVASWMHQSPSPLFRRPS